MNRKLGAGSQSSNFRLDGGAWFKLAASFLFYLFAGVIGDSLAQKCLAAFVILSVAAVAAYASTPAPKQTDSIVEISTTGPIDQLFRTPAGECRLPPELAGKIIEFFDFKDMGRSRSLSLNWLKLNQQSSNIWSSLYLQRFGSAQHLKAGALLDQDKSVRQSRWMKQFKEAYLVELFIQDNKSWCSANMTKLCSLCRNDKAKELAQTLAPFPSTGWGDEALDKALDKARAKHRFQPCHGTVYSERQWHINKTHNGHGDTLLITAVQQGHLRVSELLLRKGANVNHQNAFGNTPLHFAFEHNYTDLAMWLIEHGADDTVVNIADLSVYDGLADTTHLPM